MTITQFGNMSEYHSDNLTYYKYHNTPSLNNIILFLHKITRQEDFSKLWMKEIENDNLISSDYFNSVNHHLIISPFLVSGNISPDIIKGLESIDNLWIDNIDDIDNFDYRDINIHNFLQVWAKIQTCVPKKANNTEIIKF